ncbi:MAG TPA: TadE/TadG family type IV pilus assembly protein [Candidatus Limnocylindrales bacterium]|jgi:Flp pilus assembly protein TadG
MHAPPRQLAAGPARAPACAPDPTPSGCRRTSSTRSTRTRAQALVEFALVLPVMILVLLLAIDFGRLFFSYIEVTNAAREGAAYGIAHPEDTAGITTRTTQETNVQADSHGTTGGMSVAVSCSPQVCSTAATSGTQNVVTVTASEPFTFLTPVLSNIIGSVNLRSSASSVALGQAGVPVTPAPCVNVPTVNGLTAPTAANSAIITSGLVPSAMDDLTSGTKNIASGQSPAAGTCVTAGTTSVSYHYRP